MFSVLRVDVIDDFGGNVALRIPYGEHFGLYGKLADGTLVDGYGYLTVEKSRLVLQ